MSRVRLAMGTIGGAAALSSESAMGGDAGDRTATRLHVLLSLVSALLIGCVGPPHAPAPSVSTAVTYPLSTYDHESGLRVVLEAAPNYGVAGAVLRVDVGSADEAEMQAGIAHLAEHLVFRSKRPSATLSARLDELGVSTYNAMTGWDATTYFAFLPEQQLPQLVSLFLEVAKDPLAGVTDAEFRHELDTVRNEMRFRAENGTPGQAMGWLSSATFPAHHPYAHAVVGNDKSLSSLTLADLRDFVKSHYTPERCTLVLSGATVRGSSRELVNQQATQHFGTARAAHAKAVSRPATKSNEIRAVEQHEAPVSSPTLWLGWATDGSSVGKDDLAFLVASLAAGTLWYNVQDRDPDVGSVDAGHFPGTRGGLFYLTLKLKRGRDPEGTARAVVQQLQHLLSDEVHQSTYFEVFKRYMASATMYSEENVVSRTLALAQSAALYGEPTVLRRRPDRMIALEAGEVADFYIDVLNVDRVHKVLVLPGASVPSPGVAAREAGRDPESIAPLRAAPPDIATMRGWMHFPELGSAVVTRLENGLQVVAVPKPGSPFHSVILGFRSGELAEMPAGTITASRFARKPVGASPNVQGLSYSTRIENDAMVDTLRSTGNDLRFSLTQLDDAMTFPVLWPNPQFTSQLEVQRKEEQSPQWLFTRAHEKALFGSHFYGGFATADQAREVPATHVYRYTDAIRRPDNGLLVMVGDFEPNSAVKLAEQVLGGWRVPGADGSQVTPPAAIETIPTPRGGINIQNQPGSTQVTVRFSCLMPVTNGESFAAAQVFEELIGGRLFGVLRERTGTSYGVSHRIDALRGGTTVFRAEADVDPGRLSSAMATLRRQIETPAGATFDTTEFERARADVARDFNFSVGTSVAFGQKLVTFWKNDWPLTTLEKLPERILSVQPAEVTRLAEHCRANAVLSALGDEARIRAAWDGT